MMYVVKYEGPDDAGNIVSARVTAPYRVEELSVSASNLPVIHPADKTLFLSALNFALSSSAA